MLLACKWGSLFYLIASAFLYWDFSSHSLHSYEGCDTLLEDLAALHWCSLRCDCSVYSTRPAISTIRSQLGWSVGGLFTMCNLRMVMVCGGGGGRGAKKIKRFSHWTGRPGKAQEGIAHVRAITHKVLVHIDAAMLMEVMRGRRRRWKEKLKERKEGKKTLLA